MFWTLVRNMYFLTEAGNDTYTHGVAHGAIHVSQEEVSELDRV